MRRTLAVALVLAGLAGCLGDAEEDEVNETEETTNTVEENNGCSRPTQSGGMAPGFPLTLTNNASHVPASVEVYFEAGPFVGDVDLALEHDGEIVWEFSTTVAGEYGGITHDGETATDMEDWTFTASTDAGYGEALIILEIAWGDGCD